MSKICTVSPSRGSPSCWSSRVLDRSAEVDSFYRREVFRTNIEPEVDAGTGATCGGDVTCTRESTPCEPSVSNEVLPHTEPEDCCRVSEGRLTLQNLYRWRWSLSGVAGVLATSDWSESSERRFAFSVSLWW